MSGSRSPFYHTRPGHPLDGIALHALHEPFGVRGLVDDFLAWRGPIAEGTDGGIILGGATGAATITRPATKNVGVIRLTTQATAGGNGYIEWPMQFGYVAGKRLWCFIRFALSDVDDIQMMMGLGTPGATEPIGTLPAEGLFFNKVSDTDQDPNFIVRDASTSTANNALTGGNFLATDDAFYILGFQVNKAGYITPYYGTDIDKMTAGTVVSNADANLPDDANDELSFYLSVQTGNGEADYMDVDWVIVQQER